jgi:cyclase
MNDLAAEKKIRSRNLFEKDAGIDDVATWRKPDRVFDGEFTELNLGDRAVQLWHFGPGNTPGDTIVYVRKQKQRGPGTFSQTSASGTPCFWKVVLAST